jgi:hypothetical protein
VRLSLPLRRAIYEVDQRSVNTSHSVGVGAGGDDAVDEFFGLGDVLEVLSSRYAERIFRAFQIVGVEVDGGFAFGGVVAVSNGVTDDEEAPIHGVGFPFAVGGLEESRTVGSDGGERGGLTDFDFAGGGQFNDHFRLPLLFVVLDIHRSVPLHHVGVGSGRTVD